MSALQETATPYLEQETQPMINGEFEGKNFLSIDQFTRLDIETILELTEGTEKALEAWRSQRIEVPKILSGFVLKAVMFEDSTRTADSYLSAASYLGAVASQPNLATSSKNKNEIDVETAYVYAKNADGVLVRHKDPAVMENIASRVDRPVTSGGHRGDHVTQTFKDLYTLKKLYGEIDGTDIVMAGHLAEYRAAISLLKGLSKFEGVRVTLVATDCGAMPEDVVAQARSRGVIMETAEDLLPLMKTPRFAYLTRPALEYVADDRKQHILSEYDKRHIVASHETMQDAHPQFIVGHPLPHNQEIAHDFYTDRRAIYLPQEECGLPIHMSLQSMQFGQSKLAVHNPFIPNQPPRPRLRAVPGA